MKTFELNNKQTIPAVGFGVFMIPNDGPTYDATLAALKAGYRHIDTAAGYCMPLSSSDSRQYMAALIYCAFC